MSVAINALRVLEEHGDSMTGTVVEELDQPAAVVIAAVKDLWMTETRDREVDHLLTVQALDEQTEKALPPAQVQLCATRRPLASDRRPLRRSHTDMFGRFAFA